MRCDTAAIIINAERKMAVPVQVKEKVSFHRDAYTSLIKGLIKQKSAGEFCDVILLLNGRCFFAHKAILASRSPYFRSMFTSHMKEQSSAEIDLTESLLLENDASFRNILDFMYSGDIEINVENAEDMLRIADFLLLEDVNEYCRQFFLQHGNLNLSNCLCLSVLAEHHNMTDVAKVAKQMVRARFHDYLIDSEELLDLPESVFVTLLRDPETTQFTSSDSLVRGIVRWTRHDMNERQMSLVSLLSFIRLQSLSRESARLLLTQPAIQLDADLSPKLRAVEKTHVIDGACSRAVQKQPSHDMENNGDGSHRPGRESIEPVIFAFNCNTALKHVKMLVYRILEQKWYSLAINTDSLIQAIPARLSICSMVLQDNILYMFLSYNLPYPTDMLRINILALDIESGERVLMTFRHRYNNTECCQTTLTDDHTVPPGMVFCHGCICVVGNMEGTGQVFVCDPTSQTYMCYQVPNTRFVSLARAVVREDRYMYIWCRHRFGHEEYCINKEVTFVQFDVKSKSFNLFDIPPPPCIRYGEFADPHVLCVEDHSVVIHTPGKSSLVLDEERCEWLTHSRKVPSSLLQRKPIEMPYHGYELYTYSNGNVYVFQNPAAYTTSLVCLDEQHTGGVLHTPPPLDGISLASSADLASSFLHSLPQHASFDETYTNLIHNRTSAIDYDTEESGTQHSTNSESEEEYELDGYEYDEDIYGYYEDYEY